MKRKLAAGNWKMNGSRAALAEFDAMQPGVTDSVEMVICPPATLVAPAVEKAGALGIGGQTCHVKASGAHTGDISAAMLKDAGASYVITGRLLSSLKGHAHLAHAVGGACHAAIALADHISGGWTQAQARALCELLPPNSGTRAEAAKRLGISRPAVDQALWSAGFPAIEAALTSWEDQ